MAIEKRRFGRTGHMSTAVLFGGAALWTYDKSRADRALDLLLEYGINHIDTAASYGEAERNIGHWMDSHRDDFFLATKTGARDYEGAKASIHRSLELLRTDRVDLIQLHALIHPEEWDQALSPGGALDACVEAREQGLASYIGVTGHGWNVAVMHKRSLQRFDFDSILLPWNWFCAHHDTYGPDFEAAVALAEEKDVAVQTIKSIARGPWAADATKNRTTWYQPLENETDIAQAVQWVLARPGIFLNAVSDLDLLPAVLRAADTAEKEPVPDDATMAGLSERMGLSSIFGL